MVQIGIDVGSTYTKYCVMEDNRILKLSMEKTPVRQSEFFEGRIREIRETWPAAGIVSCGYGRKNVPSVRQINELTALAGGTFHVSGGSGLILDIGGQDTKLIEQDRGKLLRFFVNDKCAAGSGMFLANTLQMLGVRFEDIDLTGVKNQKTSLSSVCAVFAQSEIVEMIAGNQGEDEIVEAVIRQILVKAKALPGKVWLQPLLLSGGLSQIKGIAGFAEGVLGVECRTVREGAYLAAVGCAVRAG